MATEIALLMHCRRKGVGAIEFAGEAAAAAYLLYENPSTIQLKKTHFGGVELTEL